MCVTHVCHAPKHVPIYRRIMRFLLWRWGESNPRPVAGPEFFSERSLRFYFSAPSIAQTHRWMGSVD